MPGSKQTISTAAVLNIPIRDAQTLIDAGNGDAALLYLHILRGGGTLDASRAAVDLHRSDRDIESAAGRLRQMGILSGGSGKKARPEPAQELPDYPAAEVAKRSMESPEFRGLLEAVQSTLGRILSSADVKKLFGLYDELGLPADVILLLVQYCKDVSRERYGPQRTVGFAFIEKEAYTWANREIVTYEQAEKWLAELERRKSMFGLLRRELGIRDRDLSKTEREYLTKWIDMGFPAGSIAIAADRTITSTQKLNWNYMDTIIASWASKGIHSPEEIEAKDPRVSPAERIPKLPDAPPPAQDDAKTLGQLARLRDRMRAGQS